MNHIHLPRSYRRITFKFKQNTPKLILTINRAHLQCVINLGSATPCKIPSLYKHFPLFVNTQV